MTVAWGGVEQWLDRNPNGIHQVSCKFSLKNTEKYQKKYYKIQKCQKIQNMKNTKKMFLKHIGLNCMYCMFLPFQLRGG